MKANPDKCHLLISQNELKIANITIKSSVCEKLLGIKIDNKLRLNAYVKDLCKKASRKILALDRVTPYMTVEKTYSYECFLQLTVQLQNLSKSA